MDMEAGVRPGQHASGLVLLEEFEADEEPEHGAAERLRQSCFVAAVAAIAVFATLARAGAGKSLIDCAFVGSTVADPTAAPAPNTLDRQFAPSTYAAPNRAWVGDITFLWTREGWLCLAVLLDLAMREIVGWAMRHTL